MPMGTGFFGTQTDGTLSREYCTFCFQNGSFTQPDMTVEEMIQLSIDNMTDELGFDTDKAKSLAESFIPQLKRWKQ